MIEIVTKTELYELRDTILEKLDQIANLPATPHIEQRWLRSSDVKRIFSVSHGKLQKMRDLNQIPFKKIDGVIIYDRLEIERHFKNI